MNTQLQEWAFEDKKITTVIYAEKPAFVAVEIAYALGYKDEHQAVNKHCKSLIKIKYGEMQCLGLKPKPRGVILIFVDDLCSIALASGNRSFIRFLKEEVAKYFNEYSDFCETIAALTLIDRKIRKNGIREKAALDTIEQLLGVKLKRQYRVGEYLIDGYDAINNVAYEIDEEQHFTPQHKKADHLREEEIKVELGCKFVRIRV